MPAEPVRPSPQSLRLFIALPLPADVADAAYRLLPDIAVLRRVRADLLHITLAFLGAVPEAMLMEVVAAAEEATRGLGAFDVALERAGRFPEQGRPRVLWLASTTGAREIGLLGERLRAELKRRNLPFDGKPLRAHLTLARVREDADLASERAVAATVDSLRVPPLSFRASRVVVFQSVLSSHGPRYTARATADLGTPTPSPRD